MTKTQELYIRARRVRSGALLLLPFHIALICVGVGLYFNGESWHMGDWLTYGPLAFAIAAVAMLLFDVRLIVRMNKAMRELEKTG